MTIDTSQTDQIRAYLEKGKSPELYSMTPPHVARPNARYGLSMDTIERDIDRAWRTRPHSPLWQSPQLKEVIVAAALNGEITEQDAADLFEEYGLREV